MAYLSSPELDQHQYDVLYDSIADNPLLPKTTLAITNKGLNTSKQSVIGAVNELLSRQGTMQTTVDTSLAQQNAVLGNVNDDTVVAQLHAIDTNVIAAIVKIYNELQAIKNGTIRYDDFMQEIAVVGVEPTTSFALKYKPCSPIQFYVNGSMYTTDCWTFDKTTNTITWNYTAANDGFDITDGFVVSIVYDFLFAENTVVDPTNP